MPLDNQSDNRSLATQARRIDVLVVGAGFAGLYLLHCLSKLGLDVRAFEAGGGVGGTWYWNRYPGARCDVESMQYSFGFSEELQQDWQWSELFSAQPEILSYANHVAERFDLRRLITFNARVRAAIFDEASARWTVHTNIGETVTARCIVMATGCLSTGRVPDFPGIETFEGRTVEDAVAHVPRRLAACGIFGLPLGLVLAGHRAVARRDAVIRRALEHRDVCGLLRDDGYRLDRGGARAYDRNAAASEVHRLMRPFAGVEALRRKKSLGSMPFLNR